MSDIRTRSEAFCRRYRLQAPIMLAPMAGACPTSLSIAVARAGGAGAAGVLLMQPDEIAAWVAEYRAQTDGPLQLNLWIPDPAPVRDAAHETRVREFLAQWGPAVPPEAGDARPPDFAAQCAAMLEAKPEIISSIMGLYPPEFIAAMKARDIAWFANATTVEEARAAEAAGADAIIAQGMEAGGHRGAFDAAVAEVKQVGLFALVPAIADAVKLPVIAAGGVADARGIAAALTLGASAVMIGTGFLRCPEAKIPSAWADALSTTAPEQTILTRAFSGRAGRSLANDYARAAAAPNAPKPAPYPVQRGLSATMRSAAQKNNDVQRMQAWSGQAAALARAEPAGKLFHFLWQGVQNLLR